MVIGPVVEVGTWSYLMVVGVETLFSVAPVPGEPPMLSRWKPQVLAVSKAGAAKVVPPPAVKVADGVVWIKVLVLLASTILKV
jgi:hypothetical protein